MEARNPLKVHVQRIFKIVEKVSNVGLVAGKELCLVYHTFLSHYKQSARITVKDYLVY